MMTEGQGTPDLPWSGLHKRRHHQVLRRAGRPEPRTGSRILAIRSRPAASSAPGRSGSRSTPPSRVRTGSPSEDQYWMGAAHEGTRRAKPQGRQPCGPTSRSYLSKDVQHQGPDSTPSPAVRLVQNPANREVLGGVTITQGGVDEGTSRGRQDAVVCGGGWEFNEEMTHNFQQDGPRVATPYGSPVTTRARPSR